LLKLHVSRQRQLSLLLTAVVAAVGWRWLGHDPLLVAAFVAAAGLPWSSRDNSRRSAWWRGQIVCQKLAGHFPFTAWGNIWRAALKPGAAVRWLGPNNLGRVKFLNEKYVDGQKWEQYQTDLGRFQIPAPGRNVLIWLLWEITVQHDYESDGVAIRPSDTVIDGGAHVGVFSAYALQQRAAPVIAIGPDPTSIACLEADLAKEIASGRVVVKAGIWYRKDSLTFTRVEQNLGAGSFIMDLPGSFKIGGLPLFPLDDIVEQLGLAHVDVIKIDIEGAERRALQGTRQTLVRFRPRMAICAYHFVDDALTIPGVVRAIQPAYEVHAKDVEYGWRMIGTKVLFFR
jgi:FkbM family methyltransferase